MTTLVKIIISICFAASCCSCNIAFNGLKGKGEVTRKEKTIAHHFDTIKASKGLDVILVKNENNKVIIEANQNLHEHIQVYVKENTLYITADENIYLADEKTVYVSYVQLNKISATSGASVTSQKDLVEKELTLHATSGADINLHVKAESLSTSVTSGALIDLVGKVNNHKSHATSGADINADNLLSLVSEAKATSGASITIHARDEFTGKATSGANIVYHGNPEKVSENDNSGGRVRKK